jgi:colicin import membrane protein
MDLSIPDVSNDIVKRITVAADQLYEESGKTSLPNVDLVRRRARVNMNDASIVMRVWRRTQTAAATPLSTAIPEAVQQASNTLLSTAWKVATDCANANLQAAQAGWELERVEAEACRQQISSAFDSQSAELALAQEGIRELERQLAAQAEQIRQAADACNALAHRASAAEARATTSEVRALEIEKRANDLRTELSLAHASADHARRLASEKADRAESKIAHLNDVLLRRAETDAAKGEEIARLRGQLEAIGAEHQALLTAIKPNGATHAETGRVSASHKGPHGK